MSKDKNKGEHKYLSYCIPVGLLIGVVIAVIYSFNIGVCAGLGMLLGVVIGTLVDYYTKKGKFDK